MTMSAFRYLVLLCFLLSPIGTLGQDDVAAPIVDLSARVKQHRFGAAGDLVEGEEEMRKIIIQWDAIPEAVSYEVCHNCVLVEGQPEPAGEILPVGLELQRAGRPVFIKPNTPLGKNTFHVRAKLEGGKSGPWSDERVFNVGDPGNVVHDEL